MSTVWQNTTGALEFFPPPGWVGCCLPPAAAAALQLSPPARAPARVPRVAPLRAKTYLCKSGQVLFVCKSDQVHCKKIAPTTSLFRLLLVAVGDLAFPPALSLRCKCLVGGASREFSPTICIVALPLFFLQPSKISVLTNYFFVPTICIVGVPNCPVFATVKNYQPNLIMHTFFVWAGLTPFAL